ncbi:MAG: helix-turn-helix domain-containing protein [Bacteroidota bacterium]
MNMFFYRLTFSLFVFVALKINGQELSKDQVFKLSFTSIDSLENQLEFGTDYSKKVFDIHILKAKYLSDTNQLAEAYRKRVWGESFEDAIKYVDSAISLSESVSKIDFISMAYYTKGGLLYDGDVPDEAVKELVKAYESAKDIKNYELIVDCLNTIALIKGEYGHQERAISLLRQSMSYLRKYEEKINNYDLTKQITLDNIARCYLQIKEIDSSRLYAKQGIEQSLKMNDLETYQALKILSAQIDYYDGNYLKARDTLLKYSEVSGDLSIADRLYYLGMTEAKLGDDLKKKRHFKRIDTLLQRNDYPLMDNVKEVFQFLLKDAISQNNRANVQNYANRLVFYDSLLTSSEKKIRSVLWTEFDLPELEESKQNFSDKISKKNRVIKLYLTLLVVIMVLFILYIRKYISIQKKLRFVMNEEILPTKNTPNLEDVDKMGIDSEVVSNTLSSLAKWEKNHGFLKQNSNQNTLAKELKTNTTYLSKIINTYKGQTFSNYLKDLRVTYAIKYLKENPKIIDSHSTIQIAERFGFNSLDVFSRALKDKIGLTPAVFLKQVKRSNL